jgi:hypothetical protein
VTAFIFIPVKLAIRYPHEKKLARLDASLFFFENSFRNEALFRSPIPLQNNIIEKTVSDAAAKIIDKSATEYNLIHTVKVFNKKKKKGLRNRNSGSSGSRA